MKKKRLEDKPACSVASAPFPSETVCPSCHVDIEIWSDETETECTQCGHAITSSA